MRYLLLIIFFIPQLLYAQENKPLAANEDSRQLSTEVMIFRDQVGDKSLTDILLLEDDFSAAEQIFNAGYTYDVHWFRITLQRTADARKDWLLSATPTFLNDLQLYIPNGQGGFELHQSGNQVAATLRPLDNQFGTFTFPITLRDTSSTVFYLRLQTQTTSSMGLSVATPEKLIQTNIQQKLLLGLLLGSLLIILIIILWLWSKEHNFSYIMLVGYILSGILGLTAIEGAIAQFVFPYQADIAMLITPLSACSIIIFFTGFNIFFFNTRNYFPRLHIALCGLTVLTLLTLLSIPFGLFLTTAPILMIAVLLLQPFQLYISWVGTHNDEYINHTVFYGFLFNLILTTTEILAVLGFISMALAPLLSVKIGILAPLLFIGLFQHFRQSEKRNQEVMIRAQVAEKVATIEKQRSKDKSTFLSLIAHEIRMPLAIIDSTVQTLGSLPSMPDEVKLERHDRIRQSVAHLTNLLENTLSSTEYTDNQSIFAHTEYFLLAPFVKKSIKTISIASDYNIKIADDYYCTADRRLLNLALSNLVVNATKYREDNTRVTLDASESLHHGQNGTLFTISNHYIAQVKPDTTKWFNKHYREKNQANIDGLGIGLYLVKEIVQAHKGSIHCSATPTTSTGQWLITFTIWLPNHSVKENKT